MTDRINLKQGQYVFIHGYPPYLSRSDLTNALFEIEGLKLSFLEFTQEGDVVIVVSSQRDKKILMDYGNILVVSEENPEIKALLKFYWGGEQLPEPDPPVFLLRDTTPKWTLTRNSQITQLIKLLSSAQKICVFQGEGVASEIGISDFRPPANVDWEIFNEFSIKNLMDPEKLEIRRKYWEYHTKLYDEFLMASPSKTHELVAYLEQQGKLISVITQNIDGLQNLALKDGSLIVSLNGNELSPISCPKCENQSFSREEIHHQFKNSNTPPECPNCQTPLKPQVLSFGEEFDQRDLKAAIDAISNCDLLVVFGSGLMHSPACNLLELSERYEKQMVTINSTKTVFDPAMALAVIGDCKKVSDNVLEMLQSGQVKAGLDKTIQGKNRLGAKRNTGTFPSTDLCVSSDPKDENPEEKEKKK